jgi:hypothetical protein
VEKSIIYCIGDSHISFFSGKDKIQPSWPNVSDDHLPFFKTYHIGPALAFNLTRTSTQTKGREKLFEILNKEIPKGSLILLSFGEIDCRVHLIKHAQLKNLPVSDMVNSCLDQYFIAVKEIVSLGYEVIIYNAVTSRPRSRKFRIKSEAIYAAYGSQSDRNKTIKLFNDGARERCKNEKLYFLETASHLADKNGNPLIWYFFDSIHLSQRAMPITLHKLSEIFPNWNFPQYKIPKPVITGILTDWIIRRFKRISKEFRKIWS